jgi:hypothetical protein
MNVIVQSKLIKLPYKSLKQKQVRMKRGTPSFLCKREGRAAIDLVVE